MYRDESDLSHESRKILVEVVRILNSIPVGESVRTLRLLSAETNAPIILSTLRDEATARRERPFSSDGNATPDGQPAPLEFEIQNPIAYPAIAQFNRNKAEKQPSVNQTKPMVPDWESCT